MTEPEVNGPRRLKWWKYLLIVSGAGLLCLLAGLWYISTDSFQALVRRRMVAEVERITGGHAEIGSFHTIPFRMQVDVRDITVHGREAATDVPLAHADRLVAQVKIISLLRTDFGFHEVVLERPVVHIAFYPDGTTNVPKPAVPSTSTKPVMEQIFALSIDRLDVRHGELLWNDQAVPMDFAVHDSTLQMDYSFLRSRYESKLLIGKVDTKFQDFRPFAWMTSAEFSLGSNGAEVKSLKVTSGRSHVEASGRVTDFRRPRLDATYDAHVDLAEIASISRRRDLRAGLVEFKGKGSWSLEDFSTTGSLILHDLGWQDGQVALNRTAVTADYSVTDQQIKISKLQGKLFGGSVVGDAQVDNWLRNVPLSAKAAREADVVVITAARPKAQNKKDAPKQPGYEVGVVHLKVRDISSDDVVAALNSRAHPLGNFRPAGLASGSVEANWKGSPSNAEVALSLDIAPPVQVARGQLPVTGKVRGTYRALDDALAISEFSLATPASKIQANGTLSGSSTVRVSVATSNLDE